MKKFIQVITLLLILFLTIIYKKEISEYIISNFIYKKEIIINNPNQYKLNYNFKYLTETDNFLPNDKKELENVFYTVLNNGWNKFTFYCGPKYKKCLDDVEEISKDTNLLSVLNNFVHPFNSYDIIYTNYNSLGQISITVNKVYHNHEIEILENKIDKIYNDLTDDKMSNKEKILAIHDYIINTTTYDTKRARAITDNDTDFIPVYQSHKAIGPLFQNMAICGGYSDAMSLFLIKMGLPNYKISNDVHIWNLVYLDNKWYHLDLTWDDPVVDTKENLLLHDYFLISTKKLFSLKNNHHFNENIFIEAGPLP